MEIITGARQTGKSHTLLTEVRVTGGIILCYSHDEVTRLQREALKFGIDLGRVHIIAWDDFAHRGPGLDPELPVYIDDLDFILNIKMRGHRIAAVTMGNVTLRRPDATSIS